MGFVPSKNQFKKIEIILSFRAANRGALVALKGYEPELGERRLGGCFLY